MNASALLGCFHPLLFFLLPQGRGILLESLCICCLSFLPSLSLGIMLYFALVLFCLTLKPLETFGAFRIILTRSFLCFESWVSTSFFLDLISLGSHPWPTMSQDLCNHNLPWTRLEFRPSSWRTRVALSLILSPFSNAPNLFSVSICTRVVPSSACMSNW